MDALVARMTPEQMDEWLAYDRVEPLGHEKLYALLRLIAAVVCNALTLSDSYQPRMFDPEYRATDQPAAKPDSDGIASPNAAAMAFRTAVARAGRRADGHAR